MFILYFRNQHPKKSKNTTVITQPTTYMTYHQNLQCHWNEYLKIFEIARTVTL